MNSTATDGASSPLILHPDSTVVLPPRLFAPPLYYAAMACHGRAVVDTAVRYDKRRKEVHRYDIADVRGPLALTVPVQRPHTISAAAPTWADAAVSDHGQWWHVHRVTLESAYGRTPYFEFVADRFASVIAPPGSEPPSVLELARRADTAVRDFLGIDTCVEWRPADALAAPADAESPIPGRIIDLRRASFSSADIPPYFQVRSAALGFIPSLSILDLIFNLGPEAPLYLRRLAETNF